MHMSAVQQAFLFDPQSPGLAFASKAALEKRYEVLPYLYTLFHDAHTGQTPFVLHSLVFDYPDDPAVCRAVLVPFTTSAAWIGHSSSALACSWAPRILATFFASMLTKSQALVAKVRLMAIANGDMPHVATHVHMARLGASQVTEIHDQFTVGEAIMIVPVLDKGATSRQAYFPGSQPWCAH
jgi:hypothetical protein